MASFRFRLVVAFASTALAATAGCSSPSRAPESDVIEVERIEVAAPREATPTEELVLPGAPKQPVQAPSPPAAE